MQRLKCNVSFVDAFTIYFNFSKQAESVLFLLKSFFYTSIHTAQSMNTFTASASAIMLLSLQVPITTVLSVFVFCQLHFWCFYSHYPQPNHCFLRVSVQGFCHLEDSFPNSACSLWKQLTKGACSRPAQHAECGPWHLHEDGVHLIR